MDGASAMCQPLRLTASPNVTQARLAETSSASAASAPAAGSPVLGSAVALDVLLAVVLDGVDFGCELGFGCGLG